MTVVPSIPAPFSFHCVICFEVFDHEDRAPVVLPCGHTFVCHQCAQRLTRCMECRTSMFHQQENLKRRANLENQSFSSNRGGLRRNCTSHQGSAVSQLRLPLPKNYLLLSLMEAAEREIKAQTCPMSTEIQSNLDNGSYSSDMMRNDDEKHREGNSLSIESVLSSELCDEDHMVKRGIDILTSTCGTYAVANRDGLQLFKHKQCRRDSEKRGFSPRRFIETLTTDMDIDNGVNQDVFDLTGSGDFRQKSQAHSITAVNSSRVVSPNRVNDVTFDENEENRDTCSFHVPFGTKLQVVHIDEEGWVTLARRQGFVRICPGSSQLVKVGGPLDEACKIEGTLFHVKDETRTLHERTSYLSHLEVDLNRELQSTLQDQEHQEVIVTTSESTDSETKTEAEPVQEISDAPPRTESQNEFSLLVSPPRKDRSFSLDNSPGVDFRTGLSGHSGMFSPHKGKSQQSRRSSKRIMSHHKGLSGTSFQSVQRLTGSYRDSLRGVNGDSQTLTTLLRQTLSFKIGTGLPACMAPSSKPHEGKVSNMSLSKDSFDAKL